MKTAIVLAGGGSKGAYQLGFYQAILELNVPFDIVTGTSIGALQGCLMVQEDYQAAYDLWHNIDISTVMKNGINIDGNIDTLVSQSNRFLPFFKQYIQNKGADITPLKELIDTLCDEEKMRASRIDFGLVTVEYPSLKPIQITKNEMEEGLMKDYLLASSSCFPAFPIHEFNNKGYIDGGYYDNLPMRLAKRMGADQFILVDLSNRKPIHQEYLNRPNITYVIPSFDPGGFLDFDRKDIERRIKMGYLDTMRAFHKYRGFHYTFSNTRKNYQQDSSFYEMILYLEAEINAGAIRSKVKVFKPQPLSDALREFSRLPYLQVDDYELAAMEICASILGIDYLQIYTYGEFKKLIIKEFLADNECNESIITQFSTKNFKNLITNLNSKEVMKLVYSQMCNKQSVLLDPKSAYSLISNECLGALYLYMQINNEDRITSSQSSNSY